MLKIKKIVSMALWCQLLVAAPGWSVEVGEPTPDFGIKSLDGGSLSRASLAGKPMMLVFWNTWCPTCKKELPQVNRLAAKYGPQGLAVLAINTGLNDSENKARAYWKKSGFVFPTGFDHYFDLGEAFGVQGVPTVLLVDAKGVVRYKSSQLSADIDERIKHLSGR